MKKHQTFDNWYTKSINENEVVIENPITTTQTTKIETNMSSDVDAIINSLETLANELTEEIESIDFNSIFEETNSVVDFVFRAPKARAAQKKVNTLLLKVANLDAAASAATDSDMKKKIANKVTTLKSQAAAVQTAVTDKFKSYSEIVQKALNSEKIKGKLEVIKTAMGDSSNDTGDLKSQASKLVVRLKKEEAAIADSAPSDEDKQKLKDDAEAKAAKKAKAEPETKPVDDNDKIKGNKEEMLPRLQLQLKAAQVSGNEEKVKKIQDLIDKVSAKESWQINGTYLGMMFEAEIKKLENDFILLESVYLNSSIKDRFASLL
jgi:hypothetical protein